MGSTVTVSETRVVDELCQMVQIDSPTFQEAEFARFLEERLRHLGLQVSNDGTGPSTGNVIARLPGNAPGGVPIAFNAHMDTVEPGRGIKPVVREGAVWSSGDTVLGADCKASIAAILEGTRAVLQSGVPRPDLELIFTYAEEGQHAGAKAVDISRLASRVCFTLDATGPVGSIITSAPTYCSLKAAFKGRAAHAGASPETGVNALVAAARAIARMPLGRVDPETTANIGLIQGGTARNAVPGLVLLEGEARSRDDGKLAAQLDAMRGVMEEEATRVGATLDLRIRQEYPALRLAPDSPQVLMARRAMERLGLPGELRSTNGGSDGSDLNEKGLPTAVLCSGMVEPHSTEEHIAVADLVMLARVVVELMAVAAES